ncbi:MAG: hypothetical protein JXR58_13300, partial [Bacteroidales bacterium]|nr:hypothetical protein [Bacteroidales bacterium]
MKQIFLPILLLVLISGCLCKKKTENISETKSKTEIMKLATIDKSFMTMPDSLDYKINSASISGDVLTVELVYKGGKSQHDFSVIFNGMYMKSYPLKIKLYLKHEFENETGKEEIVETRKFDLKPIQSPGKEPML